MNRDDGVFHTQERKEKAIFIIMLDKNENVILMVSVRWYVLEGDWYGIYTHVLDNDRNINCVCYDYELDWFGHY